MKQKFFLIFAVFFFLLLLSHPGISFTHAKAGLLMWFQTLLPSLLPFMILSNFLVAIFAFRYIPAWFSHMMGFLTGLSHNGVYAFCLGLFCGYPMGAKVTADLYRRQAISKQEAQYLLTFSNCASPAFLASFVLCQTLQSPQLLKTSCILYYLANYLTSVVFRLYYRPSPSDQRKVSPAASRPDSSWMEALDTSIMNGFETITKLGGYIILFSILSGFAKELLPDWGILKTLILCATEITTGITILVNSGGSFLFCYVTAMSMTAFGGLCILAQTKSMLQETDLSLKPYFFAKCCNMLITACLCLLFIL